MVMEAVKVLSEEEEEQLRDDFMRNYLTYLHKLLTDAGETPELCAFQLDLPYVYYLKDGRVVNAGDDTEIMPINIPAFTVDEFKFVMNKYGHTIEESLYLHKKFREQTKEILFTLPLFLEMCSSRYFLVSARLDEVGNPVGHQTILLFDKEKKECIAIEPQIRMQHVVDLYKKLLIRLEIPGYTIIEPPDECVQSISKDRNCMFWSLLIVTKYLEGNFATIKDVNKEIISKYPNQDDLKKYIEAFKYDVYEKGKVLQLPKGGRKWAASTGNRNRNRSKRHPLRQRKSKSKSLKSARRTRRRV
jgi:hypothetical protein